MTGNNDRNAEHCVNKIYDELKELKSIFPHKIKESYTSEDIDSVSVYLDPKTKKIGKIAIIFFFIWVVVILIIKSSNSLPGKVLWDIAWLWFMISLLLFWSLWVRDMLLPKGISKKISTTCISILFLSGASLLFFLFTKAYIDAIVYFLVFVAILPYILMAFIQAFSKRYRHMQIVEIKNGFLTSANLFLLWFKGKYVTSFKYNSEIQGIVDLHTKTQSNKVKAGIIATVIQRIDKNSRDSVPMFALMTILAVLNVLFWTSVKDILEWTEEIMTNIEKMNFPYPVIHSIVELSIAILIPIVIAALVVIFVLGVIWQTRKKIYLIMLDYLEK